MDKLEFLENFAEQFDDTDVQEIDLTTIFHDLDEWSSLTGMSIMAMVKTEYGKTLTGKELRECSTVEDVYNIVKSK